MPPTCEWFVLCDEPAFALIEHPVLGDVPICRRCAQKLQILIECKPLEGAT